LGGGDGASQEPEEPSTHGGSVVAGKRGRTAHSMTRGRGSSRGFHNEAGWGGKRQGEEPERTAAKSRTGNPRLGPCGNATSPLSLADKSVHSPSVSALNSPDS